MSAPSLHLLLLQGTLQFADGADLQLNASYIFIHGGRLRVGTPRAPFLHQAVITLQGARGAAELPVYGAKCIGVRTGVLELHGRPEVAWTRLAASAPANSSWLTLRQPVAWRPGSSIVVASTSFEQEEAEQVTVERVVNGTRVRLTQPLLHTHLGDGWSERGADSHGGAGWADHGERIPQYSAEVGTSTLLPSSDFSLFPSTCSSLPLVVGCSNVAC